MRVEAVGSEGGVELEGGCEKSAGERRRVERGGREGCDKAEEASAGSTRAKALARDDDAIVIRNCSAKGSGRGEASAGGMGVRRNVCIIFAIR